MASYNTYRSNAAEVPIMRKWFFRAFILSVLLHAGLFVYFHETPLRHFSMVTDRLRPGDLGARTVISAKLLKAEDEPEPEPPKKTVPDVPKLELPPEQESFEKMLQDVRVTPGAPEEVKPIINEKPKVEGTNLQAMAKMKESASKTIERELDSVRDQIIKDKPKVASDSFTSMSDAAKRAGTRGSPKVSYSNLDALLGAGTLKGPVAPLNFPGGALFEFNQTDILPAAEETLRKLGRLIEKNPRATFVVEGYADSIGESSPEGHQHNVDLSQQRADAVKDWLVRNMHINPARIDAKGFGSTKFIVPPTGDADQEAKNRRVEIVIHTPM
jgi:outer membrane protein OmpA-like peptidoglycan-associated protein